MPITFAATYADYRQLARQRLPRFLFDYVDGGAGAEQTLNSNTQAWQKIALAQRVLVNVEKIDTRSHLLGETHALPLVLAPVGLAGMLSRRGEVQAMRAAQQLQIPFTLSTVGICPLAEVARATTSPFWFQLYMIRDRTLVAALLEHAWEIGCRTLVFTVDLAATGLRHRDTRNGLGATGLRSILARLQQLLVRPAWLWDVGINGGPLVFGNLSAAVPDARSPDAFKDWVDAQFDPSVTWTDIEWLRARWQGKLIIKGILSSADAEQAIQCGADALVVSNHGGRQLEGAPATATVLPHLSETVAKRVPLLIDGGIRSGVDLFRALALGADAVMVGRPWAMALAAGGERAIQQLLASWQQELKLTMMLTGATRLADIDRTRLDLTARLTGEQP